jgi:hypothetical protein
MLLKIMSLSFELFNMRNTQFWKIHFMYLPNWCLWFDAWAKRKSVFKKIKKIIDFYIKINAVYLIFRSICNLHSKRSKRSLIFLIKINFLIFFIFLWFTLEKVWDFKYHTIIQKDQKGQKDLDLNQGSFCTSIVQYRIRIHIQTAAAVYRNRTINWRLANITRVA